jgi:hypothetical protein
MKAKLGSVTLACDFLAVVQRISSFLGDFP